MRKLAVLLPLPLLLALAAWGSSKVVDVWGPALGAALSEIAKVVRAERALSNDGESDASDVMLTNDAIPVVTLIASGPAEANSGGKANAKGKKGKPNASVPARSIFVPAGKVLALANSRVTPKGVRVAANGSRPAGLLLKGVSGLGIGLRDGDVLTRALGQPALSSSAVVRAILSARARRVKVLEGEFFRGQERWILRVEQPYLDAEPRSLTADAPGPRLPAP